MELLAAYLQSHPLFGSFLVDAMGLGKTFTSLIYASYVPVYCLDIMEIFMPTLIVATAGLVCGQWKKAIIGWVTRVDVLESGTVTVGRHECSRCGGEK